MQNRKFTFSFGVGFLVWIKTEGTRGSFYLFLYLYNCFLFHLPGISKLSLFVLIKM